MGGRLADAFRTITAAVKMDFSGRFIAARRILQEDQAILASAWKRACPDTDVKALMNSILDASDTRGGADEVLNHLHARTPTLRFVLNWETDANDVDFHIYDSKGGHAYYSAPGGAPPGVLYGDVTQGWGPECFAITQKARNFPYKMQAHYFRSARNMTFICVCIASGDLTCTMHARMYVCMHACMCASAPVRWASAWENFRSWTRRVMVECFCPNARSWCRETGRSWKWVRCQVHWITSLVPLLLTLMMWFATSLLFSYGPPFRTARPLFRVYFCST